MPHDFARFQGAAMAQVKTSGATFHHTVQFAGDRLRVVFKGRTDRMIRKRNSADQDTRCEQIADQGFL